MDRKTELPKAKIILDRLKTFNRKERDHLMKFALCDHPETPVISQDLRNLLSHYGQLEDSDPSSMFIGMDYHLNWLFAALATADEPHLEHGMSWLNQWAPGLSSLVRADKNLRPIQENQEDIDLLIAWYDKRKSKLHLTLLEAKLDSGWTSAQFKSKKERLTLIKLDSEQRGLTFIDWHLLLISPGNAPTRYEFALSAFEEPYHWMLEHEEKTSVPQLRHATLPLRRRLKQVGLVPNSKGEWWTTTTSLKPNL